MRSKTIRASILLAVAGCGSFGWPDRTWGYAPCSVEWINCPGGSIDVCYPYGDYTCYYVLSGCVRCEDRPTQITYTVPLGQSPPVCNPHKYEWRENCCLDFDVCAVFRGHSGSTQKVEILHNGGAGPVEDWPAGTIQYFVDGIDLPPALLKIYPDPGLTDDISAKCEFWLSRMDPSDPDPLSGDPPDCCNNSWWIDTVDFPCDGHTPQIFDLMPTGSGWNPPSLEHYGQGYGHFMLRVCSDYYPPPTYDTKIHCPNGQYNEYEYYVLDIGHSRWADPCWALPVWTDQPAQPTTEFSVYAWPWYLQLGSALDFSNPQLIQLWWLRGPFPWDPVQIGGDHAPGAILWINSHCKGDYGIDEVANWQPYAGGNGEPIIMGPVPVHFSIGSMHEPGLVDVTFGVDGDENCWKTATLAIIKADIDDDCGLSEEQEDQGMGVLVFENNDDDNTGTPGHVDKDDPPTDQQSPPAPDDDDLARVTLAVEPAIDGGTITLCVTSGAGTIRVYRHQNRSGLLLDGQTTSVSWTLPDPQFPSIVYVEGFQAAPVPTASLALTYGLCGQSHTDALNVTVALVDLDASYAGGGLG